MILALLSVYLGFRRHNWMAGIACGLIGSIVAAVGALNSETAAVQAFTVVVLAYWLGRGIARLTGRGTPPADAASDAAPTP